VWELPSHLAYKKARLLAQLARAAFL